MITRRCRSLGAFSQVRRSDLVAKLLAVTSSELWAGDPTREVDQDGLGQPRSRGESHQSTMICLPLLGAQTERNGGP